MANSGTYKHVKGIDAHSRALRALSADLRGKILGKAVGEAIAPVLVAAKRFAKRSVRTGALRNSLTSKVVVYDSGVAVGLVGPNKAYYSGGKRISKLTAAVRGQADRPANYAHLVEFGHYQVAGNSAGKTLKRKGRRKASLARSGKKWVPAKPFLRPAVQTTLAAQEAGWRNGIKKGWEQTIRKHSKST